MMRVVVLGSTGMLGSMVRFHLERAGLPVVGLARPAFDVDAFLADRAVLSLSADDLLINCVGVIKPFCRDDDPAGIERAIRINALFPHLLAREVERAGARLLQIATDCVYAGTRGAYDEGCRHDPLDVYGKTKSLGEPFGNNVLNIRCSIIGPEISRVRVSLLEWFLAQPSGSVLSGFAHHRWNGVTTLQFARLCEMFAVKPHLFEETRKFAATQHFVPNEALTKDDLLRLFAEVFGHRVSIRRVDDVGEPVDRTLSTRFPYLARMFPAESQRGALEGLHAALPAYRARYEAPINAS